jgi:hypothetical protein
VTTHDGDDELRARLRAADPASALPPADPTRVARLLEETMSNQTDTPLTESRETGTRGRSPLTWLVAAAAAVLVAGVGIFGFLDRGGDTEVPSATDQRTVTHLDAPAAGGQGRCLPPSARVLSTQTLAFDGTVQAIDDGVVTLAPTHFYAGNATDLVEIEAPSADLQALIGAARFEAGGRYLVSATDGRVTVCGMTAPYSAGLATLSHQAFS